jgi:hypothetical protein
MKRPALQLRLWWLLGVVMLAALDCLALRSPVSGRPLASIMSLLAVLPMANILALGMMPLSQPRDLRREQLWFWGGFELAGVMVLLILLVWSIRVPDVLREMLLGMCRGLGVPRELSFLAAAVTLLAPQLLLAYLGGRLSCRLACRDTRPDYL